MRHRHAPGASRLAKPHGVGAVRLEAWNFSREASLCGRGITTGPTEEAPAAMYSIFYIIGVVVVILAVLSLLGLA